MLLRLISLIISLFLGCVVLLTSGCCNTTDCQSVNPCALLACCPKKQDDTYRCCIQRCHIPFCPRVCPGGCTKRAVLNQLACQGVQLVELGNRVNIILYTDNCFEHGTANIDESCIPAMDNITRVIKAYGDICPPIKVTGYTDNIGSNSFNKCCLSRQMADSVVAYLWTHGVNLHMLCGNGCGCNNPIASPHTACGHAFNRRVEITFWRKHLCDPFAQSP